MKVPLLDLKAQYASIKDEIVPVLNEVCESQMFILGKKVAEFESRIAEYCGVSFASGCASGTDALLLSIMAFNIGAGDEIITTPYTFFATAGSIHRVGARTVFVDIKPDTFNIDPSEIEKAITPRTKAIIPVHLYGQPADMAEIMEIAGRYDLKVIEDAAQSIGAKYNGRNAGAIGDTGCFSFFPSKNLGCFGDGGMVVTNSKEIDDKIKVLRVHGSSPKYYHSIVGLNSRLDALQASVLSVKLRYLNKWSEKRGENADNYKKLFIESNLFDIIKLPVVKEGNTHIYNQFVIRVEKRDELIKYLAENEIGCEIYYPVPLHLQECFKYLGYGEGSFPESERAAKETLALPVYPELTYEQQEYVVSVISRFYKGK